MKQALGILTILFLLGFRAGAQEADAYKFAPPPPPPLDDYEEFDDEGFETDDAFRPPPPPIPPGGQPGAAPPPPPPPPDIRNSTPTYAQPGKFRFKIVEGEYWEPKKKRARGAQIYGRSSGK